MRSHRLIIGILTVIVALAAAASHGRPAHAEIERAPEFRERIDDAILGGVAYLRHEQRSDGRWPSRYDESQPCATSALAYHTLAVCGVSVDDTMMQRAYKALREDYKSVKGNLPTYAAGILMMAIADHATPAYRDSLDNIRRDEKVRRGVKNSVSKADKRWMRELVRRMSDSQDKSGAWNYGGRVRNRGFDNSNTQYAVLGLRAAARMGVDVPIKTWRRLYHHLLGTQNKDGAKIPRPRPPDRKRGQTWERVVDRARGWGYRAADAGRNRDMSTATMTLGCLGSLIICRAELSRRGALSPDEDAAADQATHDGLAWVERWSKLHSVRRVEHWIGYILYGLERAARLGDREYIGEFDWYASGVDKLLHRQEDEGRFAGQYGSVIETCFALLFLRRGTAPVRRVTPVTGDAPLDWDLAEASHGEAFESFVDLVLSRWRRAQSKKTRAAVVLGTASLGPRVVLPLLRRMDASAERTRVAAYGLLTRVTDIELSFDAAADGPARAEALEAWELWYLRAAEKLEYDQERGRLSVPPK